MMRLLSLILYIGGIFPLPLLLLCIFTLFFIEWTSFSLFRLSSSSSREVNGIDYEARAETQSLNEDFKFKLEKKDR